MTLLFTAETFFVRGVKTIFNPLAFFPGCFSLQIAFRACQTGKLFHALSLIVMLNFVKILINLEESSVLLNVAANDVEYFNILHGTFTVELLLNWNQIEANYNP